MVDSRIQDLTAGTPAATGRIPYVPADGSDTNYSTPVSLAESMRTSLFSGGANGDGVVYSGGTPIYVNQDFSFTANIGDLKQTSAYAGGTILSLEVPYDCTIEAIRMKGSSTAGAVVGAGTATLDVYKSTYATFASMGTAQTIFGTATKPNLTGTATYENTSLTGYTVTLSKGDWLTFVMTNAGFVWTAIAISGRKTAVS